VAEGISASNGVISTSGVGGSYIRILRSDSAVPGGRRFITLFFGDEPPGAGAPSHAHSREEEAFYALSGELVIELEGEPVPRRVAPGWFFSAPAASVMLSATRAFHFTRVFTRSVGMTPHRYVVHLRLQRAIELVREGQSGLAEIAVRTGFADQSHLSRWVRRVHGVPPTQLVA
jgi:hypothetical protein